MCNLWYTMYTWTVLEYFYIYSIIIIKLICLIASCDKQYNNNFIVRNFILLLKWHRTDCRKNVIFDTSHSHIHAKFHLKYYAAKLFLKLFVTNYFQKFNFTILRIKFNEFTMVIYTTYLLHKLTLWSL